MLTVTDVALIRRPQADVFACCANPLTQREWDADLEAIEQVTPGPMERGTRFRTRFKALGTTEFEVAEYDPPHSFTWYSAIPRWENWHRWDFAASPEGTRLTQRSSFKLRGVWVLARPVIQRLVARRLAAMARAIDAYLTAPRPA